MVTVEFAASLRRHVACAPQRVSEGSLRVVLDAALAARLGLAGASTAAAGAVVWAARRASAVPVAAATPEASAPEARTSVSRTSVRG